MKRRKSYMPASFIALVEKLTQEEQERQGRK